MAKGLAMPSQGPIPGGQFQPNHMRVLALEEGTQVSQGTSEGILGGQPLPEVPCEGAQRWAEYQLGEPGAASF